MENSKSTEKWASPSIVLSSEERNNPMLAITHVFKDHSLNSLLDLLDHLPAGEGSHLIERVLHAAYLLSCNCPELGYYNPFTKDHIHNGISKVLASFINMMELRMKIAQNSIEQIMGKHEMTTFVIQPEVAYYISTFQMIIKESRTVFKDLMKCMHLSKEDFTFSVEKTCFNLALFIDEVTSPFRLFENTLGNILDIKNTISYSTIIESDKSKLNFILTNLLHLAFFHSNPHQLVTLKVKSRIEKDSLYLDFSVKCRCHPIPTNDINRLFETVHISDVFNEEDKGMLYMSNICIKELWGSIKVISNIADTVFEGTIPYQLTS